MGIVEGRISMLVFCGFLAAEQAQTSRRWSDMLVKSKLALSWGWRAVAFDQAGCKRAVKRGRRWEGFRLAIFSGGGREGGKGGRVLAAFGVMETIHDKKCCQ